MVLKDTCLWISPDFFFQECSLSGRLRKADTHLLVLNKLWITSSKPPSSVKFLCLLYLLWSLKREGYRVTPVPWNKTYDLCSRGFGVTLQRCKIPKGENRFFHLQDLNRCCHLLCQLPDLGRKQCWWKQGGEKKKTPWNLAFTTCLPFYIWFYSLCIATEYFFPVFFTNAILTLTCSELVNFL